MTDSVHAYFDIVTKARDDDGTLRVYGKATDSSLDIDGQICDADWLRKAMPSWFRWGNIREQHSSIAAGVATAYDAKDDGHYIEAKIVDPTSAKKVEEGVLKGFSVGIRAPRIASDKAAPGGRIVDGEIVEVSLVDRPANSNCKVTLVKAVGDPGDERVVAMMNADGLPVLGGVERLSDADVVGKRDPTAADRADHGVDTGQDEQSFPIADADQLKRAIQSYGRARPQDQAKVKAHIMARAKALGRMDLVPDEWKKAAEATVALGAMLEKVGQADLNAAVAAVAALLVDEAAELAASSDLRECADLESLVCALGAIKAFAAGEALEGGDTSGGEAGEDAAPAGPGPLDGSPNVAGSVNYGAGPALDAIQRTQRPPGMGGNMLTYAALADIVKNADAGQRSELRSMLLDTTEEGPSEAEPAWSKAIEALERRLGERIEKVEKAPMPGGPVRAVPAAAVPSLVDVRSTQVAYYRKQAAAFPGSDVAKGYAQLATDLEAELVAEGKTS